MFGDIGGAPLEEKTVHDLFQAGQVCGHFAFKRTHSLGFGPSAQKQLALFFSSHTKFIQAKCEFHTFQQGIKTTYSP